jgi:hypothetical protein
MFTEEFVGFEYTDILDRRRRYAYVENGRGVIIDSDRPTDGLRGQR